jgi:putative hydrolase of the HAD superfamily
MIKAIVFDIDETLVDHYKAIEKALHIFHGKKSLAEKTTVPELIKYWDQAERIFFELYLQGKMTILQQRIARIQYVYKQFRIELNESEAKKTIEEYLLHYQDCWELFSDVAECLDSLKEYKLGIISNGDSVQQRMKLERTGIVNHFSMTLISGDIGIPKPKKEIFEEALKRLDVNASEAIYVGDDPIKDVEGALSAGIFPVLIDRYNKKTTQVKASVKIVQHLKDFQKVIKGTIKI